MIYMLKNASWMSFAFLLLACGRPHTVHSKFFSEGMQARDTGTDAGAELLKQFPWLVRVSSEYIDSGVPNQKATYQGYGFVVRVDNQHYIVTTSHLSQGKVEILSKTRSSNGVTVGSFDQVKISRYDEKAESLITVPHGIVMSDNLHDVEVIALLDSNSPALAAKCTVQLTGSNEKKQLGLCVEESIQEELASATDLRGIKYLPLGLKGFIPKTSNSIPPEHFPLLGQDLNIAKAALTADSDFVSPFRHDTGFDVIDDQLLAPAEFSSGMSGLPFLRVGKDQVPAVLGMVQSRATTFQMGWMVDMNHALLVLGTLHGIVAKQGPRSPNVPSVLSIADGFGVQSEWQMVDGNLMRFGRIMPLDLYFYESLLEPSLEGEGQLDRAPSGNGVRADTGTQAEAIQHIRKYRWGMAVRAEKLGVKEWMPASSFQVNFETESHLLPANLSGIRLLAALAKYGKEHQKRWTIHVISPNAHILPYWRQHLAKLTTKIDENHYASDFVAERFHLTPGTKPFRTELHFEFSAVQLRVHLKFKDDEISFALGERGELIGGKEFFEPIITVNSIMGREYQIDLSNLLYFDPSKGSAKFSAFVNRFMIRSGGEEFVLYNRLLYQEVRRE